MRTSFVSSLMKQKQMNHHAKLGSSAKSPTIRRDNVFISHGGKDRCAIALRKRLNREGIFSFVDNQRKTFCTGCRSEPHHEKSRSRTTSGCHFLNDKSHFLSELGNLLSRSAMRRDPVTRQVFSGEGFSPLELATLEDGSTRWESSSYRKLI